MTITKQGTRKSTGTTRRAQASKATRKKTMRKRASAATGVKRAKKATRRVAAKPAKRTSAARKTVAKATKTTPTRKTGAAKKKGTPARRKARAVQSPDAIAVLKADHRAVEQLFKRFERAGDSAYSTKRHLVDSIIEELSRHAEIEELVFYPAIRNEVRGITPDVLEALEEHHVVKLVLHELEDFDVREDRFDAKVTVLMENVRHHVKEEENELFPEVRDGLDRARLRELGEMLRDAKPRVPTRPHPASPDEPPANGIVSGAVAALDQARSAGKRVIDRVVEVSPG